MLVDHLMHEYSLAPTELSGYLEHNERTHVAVALCVASGVADAGIGVEAAALEFGLHFLPLVEEDYFLACLKANIQHAAVQRLCAALASDGWKEMLENLAGYQPATAPGRVLLMEQALPWWRQAQKGAKRRRAGVRHGLA